MGVERGLIAIFFPHNESVLILANARNLKTISMP
jgi:hypothetical protein